MRQYHTYLEYDRLCFTFSIPVQLESFLTNALCVLTFIELLTFCMLVNVRVTFHVLASCMYDVRMMILFSEPKKRPTNISPSILFIMKNTWSPEKIFF